MLATLSCWLREKRCNSFSICVHDVIFEEFVDCSVMEKDNFADVQLDKSGLSEESFYQSRDMYQEKTPKEFKLGWFFFFSTTAFLTFQIDLNGIEEREF